MVKNYENSEETAMNTTQTTVLEPGAFRQRLLGELNSEWMRLKVCILSTLAFGLLAHGYGFLNFTINHDALKEFYLSFTTPWKVSLGRFAEPVLRWLMGEVMTLPWLTGIVGLIFAGLAVWLISKMFSLNALWENLILSGICVTNVTVTALIASYLHDFCGDMLALLLAVYAAWAWHQMRDGFSWKKTLTGALCLAVSLGLYQSYLAVTITLMGISSIMELMEGRSAGKTITHLLRAIPMGIAAVVVYYVCVSLSMELFHVEAIQNDYNLKVFLKDPSAMLKRVADSYRLAAGDLFRPNYKDALQAVFDPMARIICVVNGLLLVSGAVSLMNGIYRRRVKGWELALCLVLILGLPGCMMCVSFFSSANHNLTRYAVVFFYLLVLLLFRHGQTNRREWQKLLLTAMMALIIFSNIQIANAAYMKKDLERQAAMSTMTRVLTRLEQYENYQYGQTPVAIIGEVDGFDVRLETGSIENAVGLNYSGQITSRNKMKQYFDIVLQYPIELCSKGQAAEIMETEAFQQMGIFPERDSIATIDGIVVVRLS